MKKGERIDRLAKEAANTRLNGDQLTNLYVEMASCAYFMATEVADLYRTHAGSEDFDEPVGAAMKNEDDLPF